uniref:MULE transposase domain-containing protein n=1 Tax=Lactuca sativa TaxID=4236 RepID=A0A9R1VG81_LACSA|nr:hypothetical protein LSAT_V11C500243430 [Lactuca sativa]
MGFFLSLGQMKNKFRLLKHSRFSFFFANKDRGLGREVFTINIKDESILGKRYGKKFVMVIVKSNKNPGTTMKIDVKPEPKLCSETRIFKRPLKEGFKKGLRDFLGYNGTCNSNNGIYPIAYAIVEMENINSWTWFLEHLGDDLDFIY